MGVTIRIPPIIPRILVGCGCRVVFLTFKESGQTLVAEPANGLCLWTNLNDFSAPHTDDSHALGGPGKKERARPAVLVSEALRGPFPKHKRTAPIDGAISK